MQPANMTESEVATLRKIHGDGILKGMDYVFKKVREAIRIAIVQETGQEPSLLTVERAYAKWYVKEIANNEGCKTIALELLKEGDGSADPKG